MLSAPAVDLEQMDKNNKKSNKKQFWRDWRPTGKFYFYCQPAYKQVVKLPGGKTPREELTAAGGCQLHRER